jgi:hypothetical protein
MSKDSEVWYQAMVLLQYRSETHILTDHLLLGPPRRLLEDIQLDIARGRTGVAERFRNSSFWTVGDSGATILWPPERHGEWVPIECKVPAEA